MSSVTQYPVDAKIHSALISVIIDESRDIQLLFDLFTITPPGWRICEVYAIPNNSKRLIFNQYPPLARVLFDNNMSTQEYLAQLLEENLDDYIAQAVELVEGKGK